MGTIKVEVTVAGGKITAIKVQGNEETPEYFSKARQEVPARIIEEQSVQVDAASGATSAARVSWKLCAMHCSNSRGEDMSAIKS